MSNAKAIKMTFQEPGQPEVSLVIPAEAVAAMRRSPKFGKVDPLNQEWALREVMSALFQRFKEALPEGRAVAWTDAYGSRMVFKPTDGSGSTFTAKDGGL